MVLWTFKVRTYIDVHLSDPGSVVPIRPVGVHVANGIEHALRVQRVVVLFHPLPDLHIHKLLCHHEIRGQRAILICR